MKMVHKFTGAIVEVAPVIKDGKHALIDSDGNQYKRDELTFIQPKKAAAQATSANTNAVHLKVSISVTGGMEVKTRSDI